MKFYAVQAPRTAMGTGISAEIHIMHSDSPTTPSGAFFATNKSTLCGLWAKRSLPDFSPEDATCFICRQRWMNARRRRV